MEKSLKSTSIFLSALAIALCVILAVGSTFSLFTSKTDGEINVDSGTVTVTASLAELETYSLGEKQTSGFANLGTAEITGRNLVIENMTPGDEAKFKVTFKNESSVAIAYRVRFIVSGKLDEALEISVVQNGAELSQDGEYTDWAYTTSALEAIPDISVSILLPKDTGDDYENNDAKIEYVLEAYQANAINPYVKSLEQLELAIEHCGKAKLMGNIVVPNGYSIVIPTGKTMVIDLNGYTITSAANDATIVNGGDLTVIGGSLASPFALIEDDGTKGNTNGIVNAIKNNAKLLLKGGEVAALNNAGTASVIGGAAVASITNSDELTVEGASADVINNAAGAGIELSGVVANKLVNAGAADLSSSVIDDISNTGTIVMQDVEGESLANSGTATIYTSEVAAVSNSGSMTANDVTATTIKNTGAGELTIKDATVNAGDASAIVNDGAALIIEGGEFKSSSATKPLIVSSTAATIKDGDFANEAGAVLDGDIDVLDGSFAGEVVKSAGTPVISGGSFDDDSANDYLARGLETVEDADGKLTVVKIELCKMGTKTYAFLQDAINDVTGTKTITLLRDANVEEAAYGANAINYDKRFTLTIDLNGHSINANTANSVFRFNTGASGATSNVTLTVKNGTINAGEKTAQGILAAGISATSKAILNLENVVINGGPASGAVVRAYSNGVINAKGVTVNANGTVGFDAAGGEIVLDNCTVNEKGLAASGLLYQSLALGVNSGGKMTVNSGTYTADPAGAASGLYVAYVMNSGGTLVINGGTFVGTVAEAADLNACGIICADTNAVVEINGGYFNSNGAILDMRRNIGGTNAKATISGGKFTSDPFTSGHYAGGTIQLGNKCEKWDITEGDYVLWVRKQAVKIGDTLYYQDNIDEAIAAWTDGKTMTLVNDVKLNSTVMLKSTEHHILDLDTYTLYAAQGQNAIEITCNGRSSASYAITVNADAENPGGITALGKACIYYKKSGSTKDRPIIRIYNGVFNGSYSINSISNGNTNCPQIWIYGGTFNANVNLTKNMLRVFGGTFNGWINCTGDTSAYREISGGRFNSWQFMTADALSKFWVGTSKDTYNVGLYVDDEGYLVVGGAVITEPGDKFEASTVGTTWSSYLKYSSAKDNGLYYTSAEMAIAKAGNGTVNVFTDEVDMTGITSKVTLNIVDTLTVTFAEGTTPAWSVASTEGAVSFTDIISGGVVTRTYKVG